jgi:hypothetical protein
VKFKYFFLITALISLQSQAMLNKKDLLSLIRSNDNTKIIFEFHEERLTSVKLDEYGDAIELEKYIALENHVQTTHKNKKIPTKLTRTFSSTIEKV